MKTRIVLTALALASTGIYGTAAQAHVSMSSAYVLTKTAAEHGARARAIIQTRRDENAAIRLLAKSGDYVFQTDVSRHEVNVISEDLKVFTFNVTAQLGPIMPVQKSPMAAIYDGSGWYVTSTKSRKDRQMLAGCYEGLRARDLK